MLARRNDVYAILFAIIVCGPITWWAMDRTPPFTEIPYGTTPDPAVPGALMESEWLVDVSRTGCSGSFQRTLIDSEGVVWAFQPYTPTFSNLPKGKHLIKSATPFRLPRNFSTGQGTILITVSSECNPLHKLFPIFYRAPPAYFNVL